MGLPSDSRAEPNKFAVPKAVAEKDRDAHGDRHIGKRAAEVISEFLRLTETLAGLAEAVDVPVYQDDIGRLLTNRVKADGWWNVKDLRPLGHVAPLEMSYTELLARVTGLYKLLENLKPGPIKQVLLGLGFTRNHLNDLRSLRLIGILCQLAEIAEAEGLLLVDDFNQVRSQWDDKKVIDTLTPLFALNGLRDVEAHICGSFTDSKIDDGLRRLGIHRQMCANGWGEALDVVYDKVAVSLKNVSELLARNLP